MCVSVLHVYMYVHLRVCVCCQATGSPPAVLLCFMKHISDGPPKENSIENKVIFPKPSHVLLTAVASSQAHPGCGHLL